MSVRGATGVNNYILLISWCCLHGRLPKLYEIFTIQFMLFHFSSICVLIGSVDRSFICLFVCLFVCLFICLETFISSYLFIQHGGLASRLR